MKTNSPFAPWTPTASDSGSSSISDLQQAAEALREAAAALSEANRNGTGSGALSLQITVTDALGDAVPFSTTTSGTDANLIS